MNRTKILIVEDEVAIANDIEEILEDNNCEVVGIAYKGLQAINMIAERQPDLILLDINLGGKITGIEVAKHVNENEKIPFVFLTSHNDEKTINQVINTNPGGFIVKPYKEGDIIPAIKIAIAKHSIARSDLFPALEKINTNLESPLTKYEYNVIKLAWKGKKNSEIASELFVSVNTVKTHLLKTYSKLSVNNRSEAVNRIMSGTS